MIDLYSMATPNGHKVHIMLEEGGLPYRVHHIDIGKGDQFTPEFLAISPNNKIPAIVDPNGPDGKPLSLFESGAILVYLASKVDRFLGHSTREKYTVLQWLMFQMGGLGPMRLYGVLDKQLSQHAYLAGDHYSIADIACFPWTRSWNNQGINWDDYPHAKRWFDVISERPAVQRGVEVLTALRKPLIDPKAMEILFGNTQYNKR